MREAYGLHERMDQFSPEVSAVFAERLKTHEFYPAAVLVPLFESAQGLSMLLTVRAQHLKHHAGQISFPGGRQEVNDHNTAATAIRETGEEIGINGEHIEVVGRLPKLYTISQYDVEPIVAIIHREFEIDTDPSEVSEVFAVPLSHFANGQNQILKTRDVMGVQHQMLEFQYCGRQIWGATATIIVALMDFLWQGGSSNMIVSKS